MMSLRVTSPIEEKGTDMDGADRDGTKREGGAANLDRLDQNCASLHLMVVAFMAHM